MTRFRKVPKNRNRMTRFQVPNTDTAGTKKVPNPSSESFTFFLSPGDCLGWLCFWNHPGKVFCWGTASMTIWKHYSTHFDLFSYRSVFFSLPPRSLPNWGSIFQALHKNRQHYIIHCDRLSRAQHEPSTLGLFCNNKKMPEMNSVLGQAAGTGRGISTRYLMKAGAVIFKRKTSTFVGLKFLSLRELS